MCRAECGNQQCEYGEACVDQVCAGSGQCRTDCPAPARACPPGADEFRNTICSGHGTCVTSAGVCECFSGYTDNTCSSCARNYQVVGRSCVFMPGSLVSCVDGVRNGNEEGVDCGGPVCDACSSHDSGGVLGLTSTQLIVCGACTVLASGALVMVALLRRRAKRKKPQVNALVLDNCVYSYSSIPAVPPPPLTTTTTTTS